MEPLKGRFEYLEDQQQASGQLSNVRTRYAVGLGPLWSHPRFSSFSLLNLSGYFGASAVYSDSMQTIVQTRGFLHKVFDELDQDVKHQHTSRC